MTENAKDVTDRLIKEAEERGEIKAMVSQLLQSDREIQRTLTSIQKDISVSNDRSTRALSQADTNTKDLAKLKEDVRQLRENRVYPKQITELDNRIDAINVKLAAWIAVSGVMGAALAELARYLLVGG